MGSAVLWINLESTISGQLAHASGVLGRAMGLAEKNSTPPEEVSGNMGSRGTRLALKP